MAVATRAFRASPAGGNAGPPRPFGLRWGRVLTHAALIGLGLIYMYPFLWVLASSFKAPNEFFSSGLSLIPRQLNLGNYVYAWEAGGFSTYFLNTILVTVITTTLVIFLTSMAGYVLTKQQLPGKKAILGVMVTLMFLPGGYTIIPTFDLVQKLGLLNSLWSVILVQAAGAMIFNSLLFIGFFSTIGKEIEEAAVVDGANLPQTYWHVMLPLATPMIATVGLFQFMNNWNSFWIPLVFTLGNSELRTMAVGMYAFVGENSTGWTYVSAGAVMSILPIMAVFFFLQRYFIEAVAGAVKG
jgi:ABC-type glycerol-3-phosphate transport system permease component